MNRAQRIGTAIGVGSGAALTPEPAYAHAGHCHRPETISTFGLAVVVALALFRPWRRASTMRARLGSLAMPVALAAALTFTACGGKGVTRSASSGGARPSTEARLQIVYPTPNAVAPPSFKLQLNLIGARVVQPARTTGKLRGDEGHIHVSIDGRLVSMTYGTSQQLDKLKAGNHAIQAEFVAVDHKPFSNRVVAAVLFKVQG